jgi:hypothetical protein
VGRTSVLTGGRFRQFRETSGDFSIESRCCWSAWKCKTPLSSRGVALFRQYAAQLGGLLQSWSFMIENIMATTTKMIIMTTNSPGIDLEDLLSMGIANRRHLLVSGACGQLQVVEPIHLLHTNALMWKHTIALSRIPPHICSQNSQICMYPCLAGSVKELEKKAPGVRPGAGWPRGRSFL